MVTQYSMTLQFARAAMEDEMAQYCNLSGCCVPLGGFRLSLFSSVTWEIARVSCVVTSPKKLRIKKLGEFETAHVLHQLHPL